MRVRPRRDRDLAACTRLLRLVAFEGRYPDHGSGAPRAWLEAEDLLAAWIAVDEGSLVGHVAISTLGHDPVSALRWRELTGRSPAELAGVSRFFVRPRSRGHGVGAALLSAAVAGIRDRELLPVLETVSDARGSIALLDDLGWRRLAEDYTPVSARHRIHRYAAPRPVAASADPLPGPVPAGVGPRVLRVPVSLRRPIAARASRRP